MQVRTNLLGSSNLDCVNACSRECCILYVQRNTAGVYNQPQLCIGSILMLHAAECSMLRVRIPRNAAPHPGLVLNCGFA